MIQVLFHVFLVALGSACGGLLRWGMGIAFFAWFGLALPWATLFVNLTGCLFLGWFGKWLTDRLPPRYEELRLFFAVGVCGSYTTFSTYELETSELLHEGNDLLAILYLSGSVVLGMLAVWVGVWLGTRIDRGKDALVDPEE